MPSAQTIASSLPTSRMSLGTAVAMDGELTSCPRRGRGPRGCGCRSRRRSFRPAAMAGGDRLLMPAGSGGVSSFQSSRLPLAGVEAEHLARVLAALEHVQNRPSAVQPTRTPRAETGDRDRLAAFERIEIATAVRTDGGGDFAVGRHAPSGSRGTPGEIARGLRAVIVEKVEAVSLALRSRCHENSLSVRRTRSPTDGEPPGRKRLAARPRPSEAARAAASPGSAR